MPDSTLDAANKGYLFVTEKCRELKSDIFSTRLMFKKTICMRGNEAAELFYNTEYFERKKVAPNFVKSTLFGHGGVQGLDGEAHRHRKQMFMSLMGREDLARIVEITKGKWIEYAKKWEDQDQAVLFNEAEKLIFESVCEWAGIPLNKNEVNSRTKDVGAMIEGAGSLGARHWRGRVGRRKTEKWIESIVHKTRSASDKGESESQNALQRFSWHRDIEGNLLDRRIVAVELINIIRPTVAIARYVTFAALALHKYPDNREKIVSGDEDYLTNFVQEVRRFFPFFPFAMARVKKGFKWRDYHFPKGTQVLLDIYGTNHHPGMWDDPETFNPDRFQEQIPGKFNLIPQGGGDFYLNHRCAGEWLTLAVLKDAVRFLTNSMEYDVPPQDLSIDLSRFPAIPKSRLIIENVRLNKEKTKVVT